LRRYPPIQLHRPYILFYLLPVADYRRNFIPGGSFFFTVNLADRRSNLLTKRIDLLRTAFRSVQARHAFSMEAMVVLPDHLHTIWTLPAGDADFANRWRLIKTVLPRGRDWRATLAKSQRQRRTWHMAAAVLGAYVT